MLTVMLNICAGVLDPVVLLADSAAILRPLKISPYTRCHQQQQNSLITVSQMDCRGVARSQTRRHATWLVLSLLVRL